MRGASEVVHGTCVALGRRGALLRGPPGSGKSDLALRFLWLGQHGPAAMEPAALVADDQVILTREGHEVVAGCPVSIRGKIEVRNVGIVTVASLASCALALVVDLVAPDQLERLPDHAERVPLLGVNLPLVCLAPFEASAPIKLALAVAHAGRS